MIYITIPKQAYQGLLPSSATTLYTVPSSQMTSTPGGPMANKAILSEILLCNTDSSSRTYTLYIIPSGGSAGDANTVKKEVTLTAKADARLQFGTVLEQGTFIQMLADSASKICATVTVAELYQQ